MIKLQSSIYDWTLLKMFHGCPKHKNYFYINMFSILLSTFINYAVIFKDMQSSTLATSKIFELFFISLPSVHRRCPSKRM